VRTSHALRSEFEKKKRLKGKRGKDLEGVTLLREFDRLSLERRKRPLRGFFVNLQGRGGRRRSTKKKNEHPYYEKRFGG